jgi:hypothetical protein
MAKIKKQTVDLLKQFAGPQNSQPKVDQMREVRSVPKDNQFVDWLKHKVRQDQTPQSMAVENKKITEPLVSGLRAASAVGQFSGNPIVKYPSMAVNSTIGMADAYENYSKGNNLEAAKDAAFALPLGLLSNWKKLSDGAKIAYKSVLSPAMLKALMAWELAGSGDDIKQSLENGETN